MSDETSKRPFTSWNHRVTRTTFPEGDEYAIREVHYDENGKVTTWTRNPVAAMGESVAEFVGELDRMIAALDRGILDITGKEPSEREMTVKHECAEIVRLQRSLEKAESDLAIALDWRKQVLAAFGYPDEDRYALQLLEDEKRRG